MKILYDYQAFYIQDAGGISNSFAQLMRHLPSSSEVKLAMRESDNVHLQGQPFAQEVRRPVARSAILFLPAITRSRAICIKFLAS